MSARATLTPLGGDLYRLHFDLVNDGPAAIELPAYEPFVDFSVLAVAGGEPVPVQQPALDIGIQPAPIRLPARGTARVETPIRLHIAADATPGTDGFVWTIAHQVDGLALSVDLNLPAPYATASVTR